MKNLLYCVLIFIIALTLGCKKKKELQTVDAPVTTNAPVASSAEYAQFKIGNYWIYQVINIDAQGNETLTNTYDSCYISNDTIIHGSTYFQFNNFSLFPYKNLMRDSSNYIINSHGEVVFAAQDFTTVLKSYFYDSNSGDTIYKSVYKMTDKDFITITPKGNFVTSNYQKKIIVNPAYANGVVNRYMNTRFCKGIGMVTQTQQIFLNIITTTERRLTRYHLN